MMQHTALHDKVREKADSLSKRPPFCTELQLAHSGKLNGGGLPKALPRPLLQRGTHPALPHVEALHMGSRHAESAAQQRTCCI